MGLRDWMQEFADDSRAFEPKGHAEEAIRAHEGDERAAETLQDSWVVDDLNGDRAGSTASDIADRHGWLGGARTVRDTLMRRDRAQMAEERQGPEERER
jgi:hypothetical protein